LAMRVTARIFVITDGGARSALWRQIVADVLGLPVVHLRTHPGSSLGAAFVAGMGVGLFESWEEIDSFVAPAGITTPEAEHSRVYSRLYGQYCMLYERLRPSFQEAAHVEEI